MIFLLVVETAFMFIPKSNGLTFTLGYQLWFKKYWKPVNQFGFRDNEIDPAMLKKKKIFEYYN